LAEWKGGKQRETNGALLRAALRWLRQASSAEAVPVLLNILPVLPDASFHQVAYEALWASVGPPDVERLREKVDQTVDRTSRIAAIPALELAAGARSVDRLQPFLSDQDEAVRLSAVRALIDRLPRPSIAALLELLESRDAGIRTQAAWLLQQATGLPGREEGAVAFTAACRHWQTWAQGPEAGHPMALGRKRHQTTRYGLIVSESFSEDMADARKGYRQFDYENSVAGGISVRGGMLRLAGDHPEGDQRLFVTAKKLLGLPAFPGRFRIRTEMGGEAAGSGTYHVGVSVGNIRLLFHPAYSGGAFRAERVSDHKYLFENQSMPFTPAAGVLHEMSVEVQCLEGGDVRLDITIADNAKQGKPFTYTCTAKREDIGPLDRIGLERSGRTGGAALFGSLVVDIGSSVEEHQPARRPDRP